MERFAGEFFSAGPNLFAINHSSPFSMFKRFNSALLASTVNRFGSIHIVVRSASFYSVQ
jgi:hypothetical protein